MKTLRIIAEVIGAIAIGVAIYLYVEVQRLERCLEQWQRYDTINGTLDEHDRNTEQP